MHAKRRQQLVGPKAHRLPSGARPIKRSRALYKVPGVERSVEGCIQAVSTPARAMYMTDNLSGKVLDSKRH